MSEAISFLLPSFVMCFILVGIHCYLGLHVLKRGIVFIDLSLAQVASLGSTVAILFHVEHHGSGSYMISLAFTFIAALYFAFIRKSQKNLSQEVMIAIVYAFASASVILILNTMAHGSEHIKEVLIGRILWVTWPDIIKTTSIYSIVAILHFAFRKIFFDLSEGKTYHFVWDFLFYALFGVVISSSVGLAGILLVFSFLIVPAQFAIMLANTVKKQLVIGWSIGVLISLTGMFVSYHFDMPAGAIIVTLFTALAILVLPFISSDEA